MIKDMRCLPGETVRIKSTAALVQGFDLSSFGVSTSFQSRPPSPLLYPSGLNPEANGLWKELFQDEVFQSKMQGLSPGEQWVVTIESFLSYCRREGIDSFKPTNPDQVNNTVRSVLFTRRYTLVRYVNRIRLFGFVRVVRQSERHKYLWLPTGTVRLIASVMFRFPDGRGEDDNGDGRDKLAALAKTRTVHMMRTGTGEYIRNLTPVLSVGFVEMKRKTARLQYMMDIRPPFYVPPNLSLQARHEWMDKQFFFPLIRGQRFENVPLRLKF